MNHNTLCKRAFHICQSVMEEMGSDLDHRASPSLAARMAMNRIGKELGSLEREEWGGKNQAEVSEILCLATACMGVLLGLPIEADDKLAHMASMFQTFKDAVGQGKEKPHA